MAKEKTTKTKSTGTDKVAESKSATRTESARGRKMKVLRITDFELIFEPSDAKRKHQKGPLSFTKSIVTVHFLSKEAEIRYYERMKILKAHSERHLLRSVFEDLKNWTAAKYLGPRGYLVSADGTPASYEYLAEQLNLPVEDIKKAIPILFNEIGLLEEVTIDGFQNKKDGDTKVKKQSKSGRKRNKTAGGGNKRTQTAGNGCNRNELDAAGTKRLALNKHNGKDKYNNKNNEQKQSATTNSKWEIITTIANTRDNAQETKSTCKDEPPTTPTTTPPNMPTESDAEGAKVIPFTGVPSRRLTISRSKPSGNCGKLGDITERMMYRYDRQAKFYAEQVYDALHLPWPKDTPQYGREIASFASVIHDCTSGLSPPKAEAICQRGLVEAQKIIKHWAKRKGKPAAVWIDLFKKIAGRHKCTG